MVFVGSLLPLAEVDSRAATCSLPLLHSSTDFSKTNANRPPTPTGGVEPAHPARSATRRGALGASFKRLGIPSQGSTQSAFRIQQKNASRRDARLRQAKTQEARGGPAESERSGALRSPLRQFSGYGAGEGVNTVIFQPWQSLPLRVCDPDLARANGGGALVVKARYTRWWLRASTLQWEALLLIHPNHDALMRTPVACGGGRAVYVRLSVATTPRGFSLPRISQPARGPCRPNGHHEQLNRSKVQNAAAQPPDTASSISFCAALHGDTSAASRPCEPAARL